MVAIVGTVLIREVSLTPLYTQEARTGVCLSVWVSLGQCGSVWGSVCTYVGSTSWCNSLISVSFSVILDTVKVPLYALDLTAYNCTYVCTYVTLHLTYTRYTLHNSCHFMITLFTTPSIPVVSV